MSQVLESVNVTGADIDLGRGDHPHPPQSAPTQEQRGMSNFVDGSGPIFSMYLEMATEEDKKMVEGWKAGADGILIFTGLFSAAVASLISVTIQDIRQNPQDTSNFYLANIYQTLADPTSNISASLPASPPPFSPPNYAVWVNTLLFLSLVISISCALLATLLQQWARRYLEVTQPRYSPHKRARIRTFYFEGVDKFLLPWAVEALPTLLHVSLFLFFAGISVFLWNVNLTIFKSVVSWIGICTALYGCITFLPIIHHDSPYHTPLSLPAWHIVVVISLVTFLVLQRFTIIISRVFSLLFRFGPFSLPFSLRHFIIQAYARLTSLEESYRELLLQGMQKTVEKTALNSPSEIDTRAFLWTFDSLDEDHELERFFSGLPGFRSSKVVDDPLPRLTEEQKEKLSTALMGLFHRSFSSDLLPESVKHWRAIICARALDPALFSYEYGRLMNSIMFSDQCMGLQTSKFGCIVRGWGNGGNQGTGLVTQAIVTSIVARVQRRDDSWFTLASSALGVPEPVLRSYAANGGNLSLAILIYVVRQQFDHFRKPYWPSFWFMDVLEAASKFDVRRTSPELHDEFCTLWNQIVRHVLDVDDHRMASWILEPIRPIYVSLHQDTDSAPTRFSASTRNWGNPPWYPVCNMAGHIHGSAPTTFARTALRDCAPLVPASLASPDAPFLAMPASLESPADVPPLDDVRPVHQTTIKSLRSPVTSPDPATAGAIQDTVNPGVTMPHPTPKTSTSPLSPTSPPAVVTLRHNEDPPPPGSPSSASYYSNILPTEYHRSIIVTTTPSASPGPTPAPDLGVAVEDVGSPKPDLCKEDDKLDCPSVNREILANTTATLDLPPQSSSLPSIADLNVAITSHSLKEPKPERLGDPPNPSDSRYDIV